MTTNTINGTYGNIQTPCQIYTYENRNGSTWYAADGSLNINCTFAPLEDGTDIETLEDFDTMTAGEVIESEDDLRACIEDDDEEDTYTLALESWINGQRKQMVNYLNGEDSSITAAEFLRSMSANMEDDAIILDIACYLLEQ